MKSYLFSSLLFSLLAVFGITERQQHGLSWECNFPAYSAGFEKLITWTAAEATLVLTNMK